MSDTIPAEYIELAKARDERVRAAVLAIEVETALQHGTVFRIVIDAMAAEQRGAITDLIACQPDQMGAIAALQAQIRAYILVRECLQTVMDHGRRQEQSLKEEARGFATDDRDY